MISSISEKRIQNKTASITAPPVECTAYELSVPLPAGAEIDREAQALDSVLAERFAEVKRTPGRVVGARKDVRLQSVDSLTIAKTKQPEVHSEADYRRAGRAPLDP
jgi:hypothetical protein